MYMLLHYNNPPSLGYGGFFSKISLGPVVGDFKNQNIPGPSGRAGPGWGIFFVPRYGISIVHSSGTQPRRDSYSNQARFVGLSNVFLG